MDHVFCFLFQCVVLALVVASTPTAAAQNHQDVQILRYDIDNTGLDGYSYAWELSDGRKREEHGHLKNQGTDKEAISVQGRYSWVDPDGVTYTVTYTADENGFQPSVEQGPSGSLSPAVVAALIG